MLKNRRWPIIAGMVLCAVCIVGTTASAEMDSIRFGMRLTNPEMVFMQGKFYERYDLKVETKLFATGIEMREAVMTGRVDIGNLGITPVSVAVTRAGDDLYLVSANQYGGGRYRVVVRVDSPYKSMKDLLGKKVAIKIGSGCYTAFLLYCEKYGWNEKDFKLLNAGDQVAIAAMEAGSVDAVIYWEPIVSILEAKGLAREVANFEGIVLNPAFLTCRREFAKKNTRALVKLLAGYADAVELMRTNPKQAARFIANALASHGQKTDPRVFEIALSHITFGVDLKPELIEDQKKNWHTLVRKGKIKGKEPKWDEIFRPEYLEMAQKLRKK
ncbi:MAG: ABC transporter substrate-binding protein [Deltaproteobacteria bacterium]|nr:ABC transporter substrate-binding protein [Deltaproteobacteria bacterium]